MECSLSGSHLPVVSSQQELTALASTMAADGIQNMFIAGRVISDDEGNLTPYSHADVDSAAFINYKTTKFAMSVVKASSEATSGPLGLMLRVTAGSPPLVEAVPLATQAATACQDRGAVKPEDTAWTEACNSDSNMDGEGDLEYLRNMLVDPECAVCPEPVEVQCVAAQALSGFKMDKAACGLNSEGLLYECRAGANCMDVAVQTRCVKDVDECQLGIHDCDNAAQCINTVGAYRCKCNTQTQRMVNGRCEEIKTCSFGGSASTDGSLTSMIGWNVNGFSNQPSTFSYDCDVTIVSASNNCYKTSVNPNIPCISFGRENGNLVGKIHHPLTNTRKIFMVSAKLLAKQKLNLIDDRTEAKEKNTGDFTHEQLKVQFSFKDSGVLLIHSTENHYTARISYEPFSFRLEATSQVADQLETGMCHLLTENGGPIHLNPQQAQKFSMNKDDTCTPLRTEEKKPSPILMDFANAFDNVDHMGLLQMAIDMGLLEPPLVERIRKIIADDPSKLDLATLMELSEGIDELENTGVSLNMNGLSSALGGFGVNLGSFGVDDKLLDLIKKQKDLVDEMSATLTTTRAPAPTVKSALFTTRTTTTATKTTTTTAPTTAASVAFACDPSNKEFCKTLAQQCTLDSMDHCIKSLCSEEQTKCSYLAKEKFLYCTVSQNLTTLIDDAGCSEDCEQHSSFAYSLATRQPTCAQPSLVLTETEKDYGLWEFGCYCQQGFVLSAGQCVRPEECGCTLDDGHYVKPWTTWRLAGCTTKLRCHADGNVQNFTAPCGPNSQCLSTDDGFVCECVDGYFGNPEMQEGCTKGQSESDGSKICYSYVKADGSTEERCDCSLGFISNCEECEDVDECKLGSHDCDLSRQLCVNVPGGWECHCHDGYKQVGDNCIDINECSESRKQNLCGANSGCVNDHGSYKCECCVGYTYDNTSKTCVRDIDEMKDLPPNAKCCQECNIDKICERFEYNLQNYCYVFNDGQHKDFSDGRLLFNFLCTHDIHFDKKKALNGDCASFPPEALSNLAKSSGSGGPGAKGPFPTSCDDPRLMSFLAKPPTNLLEGALCGPTTDPTPKNHPSYEEMVRSVCKALGSPSQLPRESHIQANPGLCQDLCPPGYHAGEASCFRVFRSNKKSQPEAVAFCEEDQGGQLAEIKNKNDDDLINKLKTRGEVLRVGGKSMEVFGFISSKTAPNYKFPWYPGEPDTDNGDHECGRWLGTRGKNEGWAISNCGRKERIICEKAMAGSSCSSPVPLLVPTPFENKCYIVIPKEVNWEDAKSACEMGGAILAEPKTLDIALFLKDLLVASYPANYKKEMSGWVGMRFLRSGWTWESDKTPMENFFWAPSQPNYRGENCINYYDEKGGQAMWHDDDCSSKYEFACEKDMMTVHDPCPVGYVQEGDKCYKHFTDKMTWHNAKVHCQSSPGGKLAEPRTEAVNAYLGDLTAKDAADKPWIGVAKEDIWVWNSDQSFVQYFSWASGQPNGESFQFCLDYWRGGFSDGKCDNSLKSVCQKPGPKKPKMGCAPGYTKTTSGTCYKKFKQSLNWYEALAFCQQSQGGHLPEPRNSQDNDILYRISNGNSEWIWIGGIWKGDDYYYTSDQSKVSYFQWAADGPSIGELHLTTFPNRNGWKAENGEHDHSSFVCETAQVPVCDDEGWLLHENLCYHFEQSSKTFDNAQANCESLGGTLAEPRNQKENAFILNTVGVGGQNVYIGARRIPGGKFVYGSEIKPVGFTKWASEKPEADRKNDCVLLENGSWNDERCSEKRSFICQADAQDGETQWQCPPSQRKFEGRCYLPVFEKKPWHEAAKFCVEEGGKLAEPKTKSLDDYLTRWASGQNMWIGGFISALEGNYHKWDASGAHFAYSNWASGNLGSNSNKQCVWKNSKGVWYDGSCSNSEKFMCEFEGKPTLLDGEFQVFNQPAMDYEEAEDYCRQRYGSLPQPKDEAANTRLAQMTGGTSFYLGVSDRELEYVMRWTDGRRAPFTKPVSNSDVKDCVMMSSGQWQSNTCNTRVTRIVCEKGVEPEFGPWSPWRACYFPSGGKECGSGTQQRHRVLTNGGHLYTPKEHELTEERTCFEPCTDDRTGNVVKTKCAPLSTCDYPDPVCGSAKPGPAQTFESECHMNVLACQQGHKAVKLYHGPCKPGDDAPTQRLCERDGPVPTVVKHESRTSMEACVGPATQIMTCQALGCQGSAGSCCSAVSYTSVEVTVSCYSTSPRAFLRHKKHVHHSATACKCAGKP